MSDTLLNWKPEGTNFFRFASYPTTMPRFFLGNIVSLVIYSMRELLITKPTADQIPKVRGIFLKGIILSTILLEAGS